MRVRIENHAEKHINNPITFSQFCDIHNLNIVIKEREPSVWKKNPRIRYYADFDRLIEIRDRGLLKGVSGNGKTALEALTGLANYICGKRLVLSANARRKEFDVPASWAKEDFQSLLK